MKFRELPIEFTVTLDGNELSVNEDGLVSGIDQECNPRICFDIPKGQVFIPFLADRDNPNRIELVKNPVKVKVRVRKSKDQVLTTYPEKNNVRILDLVASPPRVFTLALVSQGGIFFLTCDQTFSFDKAGTQLLYPRPWPSLVSLVEGLTAQPVISGQPSPPPDFDKNIGVVSWWDSSLGLGSIWIWRDGKKMEASVWWKEIVRPTRRYLIKGEEVLYGEIRPRVTTIRESNFKFEAVSVAPLLT